MKQKLNLVKNLREGIAVLKKLREEDEEKKLEDLETEIEDTEDDAEDLDIDVEGKSTEEISDEADKAEVKLDDEIENEQISESAKKAIKRYIKLREEEAISDLEDKFEEYKTDYADKMLDKQDEYLQDVVESWMKSNKVAIKESVKVRLAESLLDDIKEVLLKHNIDLSQDQVDLVDQYKSENDELKDELNDKITESIKLKKQLKESKKALCLQKVLSEMNCSKAEKFKLTRLAESVEYVDDEQFYSDLDKKADSIVEPEEEIITAEIPVEEIPTEKMPDFESEEEKDEEEVLAEKIKRLANLK